MCQGIGVFWVGLCPLKQEIESRAEWKGVQSNGNKLVFTVKQVVTLFSSCGSQRPEVANVWHVPSICWNHHDRAPSEWQEEEVHNEVKEQQLGSQIQWNLSLVRVKNSLGIWCGKCRRRGQRGFSSVHKQPAQGPKKVHERVAWPSLWCLGRKSYIMVVSVVGGMLRSVLYRQYPLATLWNALYVLWTYFTVLHHFNELLLVELRLKVHYIFLVLLMCVCIPTWPVGHTFLTCFQGYSPWNW